MIISAVQESRRGRRRAERGLGALVFSSLAEGALPARVAYPTGAPSLTECNSSEADGSQVTHALRVIGLSGIALAMATTTATSAAAGQTALGVVAASATFVGESNNAGYTRIDFDLTTATLRTVTVPALDCGGRRRDQVKIQLSEPATFARTYLLLVCQQGEPRYELHAGFGDFDDDSSNQVKAGDQVRLSYAYDSAVHIVTVKATNLTDPAGTVSWTRAGSSPSDVAFAALTSYKPSDLPYPVPNFGVVKMTRASVDGSLVDQDDSRSDMVINGETKITTGSVRRGTFKLHFAAH
jgi:hypothetical protein